MFLIHSPQIIFIIFEDIVEYSLQIIFEDVCLIKEKRDGVFEYSRKIVLEYVYLIFTQIILKYVFNIHSKLYLNMFLNIHPK